MPLKYNIDGFFVPKLALHRWHMDLPILNLHVRVNMSETGSIYRNNIHLRAFKLWHI